MNNDKPTVLTRLTLDEARSAEPEMQPTLGGILKAHGHATFTAPIVGQVRRSDFPKLFPEATVQDGPVVVICLPDWMRDDLEELAASGLFPVNVYSRDLMKKKTYLFLVGNKNEIRIEAARMTQTLDAINDNCLLLMLVCDDQLLIVSHTIDEDWCTTYQCSMMTAGVNYRPYRENTEVELAEAARRDTPDEREIGPVKVWRPYVTYKA